MLGPTPEPQSKKLGGPPPTKRAAASFPREARLTTFNSHDRVEYRWAASGPFVGEARIVEVLPGGRYRLERIDGTRLPKEGSIFAEAQLRLKPLEPVA